MNTTRHPIPGSALPAPNWPLIDAWKAGYAAAARPLADLIRLSALIDNLPPEPWAA